MKENIKKINKKLIIISLIIFAIFLSLIWFSFAFPEFIASISGKLTNEIDACEVDVSFNEEDGISLLDTFPLDDTEIGNYEPYKVTVTNNSDCGKLYLNLNMESSCDSCSKTDGECNINGYTCDCDNQIDEKLIKYQVVDTTNNETYNGINPYDIDDIVILLNKGESVNLEIKIWINKGATNSDIYIDDSNIYKTKDFCSKIKFNLENEKPLLYETIAKEVNTSITPNYNYISNYNTNNINTNDNGVFLYNGTDDNNGDKDIYYYRGNVDNNNVLFGGFCWKIIRTTSTGGTKMIYNGVPTTGYTNLQLLEQSEYINLKNNSSIPFTYNTSTNKWTSGAIGHLASTEISFTVSESENYFLEYDVSTEAGYDKVYIYKDDTNIKIASGSKVERIDLGVLTPLNVIKVIYIKDRAATSGRDNVTFKLYKTTKNSIISTTCNNTETNSIIKSTSFNSNTNSPSDVGYMYGTRYTISTKTMTSIEDTYIYGNDVTYENGIYTLVDTVTSIGSNWGTDRITLANKKHYTCFNTTGTCSEVYYITNFNSSTTSYYLTFTDGDTLEIAKEKMNNNENNSTIKTVIDNWYNTNLIDYSSFLENTIFCNERTLYTGSLYSKDDTSTSYSFFKTRQRLPGNPSLTCLNNNDRFSLNIDSGGTLNYGNNALIYPIGLITEDESILAGGGTTAYADNYLYIANFFWTLSPYDWYYNYSSVFFVVSRNISYFDDETVGSSRGVRPVISLKYGTIITSGDGSYFNPYIIKY